MGDVFHVCTENFCSDIEYANKIYSFRNMHGIFPGVPDYLESSTFMYLNALFNGLQGFFLFIVYCLLSKTVREAAQQQWRRYRNLCH